MNSLISRIKARLDGDAREMVVGSALAFAVKIAAAGTSFVLSVLVARALGADEAGLFFLAFTLVTIMATLGRIGTDNALVRFVSSRRSSDDWGEIRGVVRLAVFWVSVVASLLGIVLFFGAEIIAVHLFALPELAQVLRWIAPAVPLIAIASCYGFALQGLKKIPQYLLVTSVIASALVVTFLLIYSAENAISVGQYYAIATCVTLVIAWALWRKEVREKPTGGFDSRLLFRTCLPLLTIQALYLVNSWAGQIILGIWHSAADVALFSTAQRTAMLTSFVLVAVNSIAAPKFAALHQQGDMQGLARLAVYSTRLMVILAFPALLLMLLFPQWLMGLFGPEFREAGFALTILALGQFINVATGSVGYLLMMTGKERTLRNNVMITSALSLTLGLILIPVLGVNGAAITSAIAAATSNLLSWYQVKKKLGINTIKFW